MIFYIFRHGETFYTKNNIPYGESYETADILPEAVATTEKMAEYLKDKIGDENYVSPFKRAIQTAEIVGKITGKKFTIDDRIMEEKISHAEETLAQMEERLRSFILEIENKKIENCAVCSHGWPIAALISILTLDRVTKFDLSCYPKCGVLTIIEGKDKKTLDFN